MRRGLMVFVIAGLLYALPAALPASAEESRSGGPAVAGIITFMEPDGTVAVMPGTGAGTILHVQPGTRIVKDGHDIPYSQLKVGDWVVGKPIKGTNDLLITVLPGPAHGTAK